MTLTSVRSGSSVSRALDCGDVVVVAATRDLPSPTNPSMGESRVLISSRMSTTWRCSSACRSEARASIARIFSNPAGDCPLAVWSTVLLPLSVLGPNDRSARNGLVLVRARRIAVVRGLYAETIHRSPGRPGQVVPCCGPITPAPLRSFALVQALTVASGPVVWVPELREVVARWTRPPNDNPQPDSRKCGQCSPAPRICTPMSSARSSTSSTRSGTRLSPIEGFVGEGRSRVAATHDNVATIQARLTELPTALRSASSPNASTRRSLVSTRKTPCSPVLSRQ